MNGILRTLAEQYAAAAHPSRTVEGGVIFGDGYHATLFCEASGFYTLAVAAASCDEIQQECKQRFTEIAKKSLLYYLGSQSGVGVCEDGEAHESTRASSLYYEGAALLGLLPLWEEKARSHDAESLSAASLSAALSELSHHPYSFSCVAHAGTALRLALFEKRPIEKSTLVEFCRALLRANDFRYRDGSPIFSRHNTRQLSLWMHGAESLFARLQGVDLALPKPPKDDNSSPFSQYLRAERDACYAYAVAASEAARLVCPSPLLSAEDISFDDGEREGVDGYPYAEPFCAMIRGGEREASVSFSEKPSVRFLPSDAPRLLSESFLGDVCGIYPLPARVEDFDVDTDMKGGFVARLSRAFPTGLYSEEDDKADTLTLAREHIAYAVLPDDETALLIAAADAAVDGFVTLSSGLCLRVPPKDSGVYYYADARHARKPLRKREGDGDVGCYLNIDDRLGVVTSLPMTLTRGDGSAPDLFTLAENGNTRRVSHGERLYAFSAAMAVGGIRKTRALAEGFLTLDALPDGIFTASAVAANRKRYTLLYNLSGKDFAWEDRTVESGTAVLLVWNR